MLKRIVCSSLLLTSLLLNGCSHPPPVVMAKLTPFQPTLPAQSTWQTRVGSGVGDQYLTLTPTIANGKIFAVSADGVMAAFDANSGHRLWHINTHVPLTSGVAANQNLIFIGTAAGVLYATQQQTGALAWRATMPGEVLAAPTVAGKLLLVKTEDGHLSALNIANGAAVWTFQQSMPSLILRASSSPQVGNNLVAAGFANGNLAVLTRENGQPLWERTIAVSHGASIITRMVDIDATPQIRDGVVYVATYQGRIAALSLQSGRIMWQRQLSSFTGLAVDDNNVYVTDTNSNVWAFNRQTGNVTWRQPALFGRGLTAPALTNKTIVVADRKGYVHWLSTQDGHFLARQFINESGVIATPVIAGNSVYIYSNDGRLVKFVIG